MTSARGKTDTSLKSEREETDRSFRKESDAVEIEEDRKLARMRAASDLKEVHRRVDRDKGVRTNDRIAQILVERRIADKGTRVERRSADKATERERMRLRDAASAFLLEERGATDTDLHDERNRHDDDLSGRDDFLAVVSHDLRSPLNAIILGSDLLHEALVARHIDVEQALETQAIIKRNARVMERLISDLLDVERMSTGKIEIRRRKISAHTLLERCRDLFGVACQKKSISLQITKSAEIDEIVVDEDRMLQVLSNLVSNAVRHTPERGKIAVEMTRSVNTIDIIVWDSGSGIALADQKRIFEKFSQGKSKSKQGLGLGLFIVKWIVEQHGGNVAVHSALGAGTKFVISVPRFVKRKLTLKQKAPESGLATRT